MDAVYACTWFSPEVSGIFGSGEREAEAFANLDHRRSNSCLSTGDPTVKNDPSARIGAPDKAGLVSHIKLTGFS